MPKPVLLVKKEDPVHIVNVQTNTMNLMENVTQLVILVLHNVTTVPVLLITVLQNQTLVVVTELTLQPVLAQLDI
jgi:hypothetical protein